VIITNKVFYLSIILLIITVSFCISDASGKTRIIKIIDGDTVEAEDGSRIRLIGINAPEYGKRCYEEATNKLKDLILFEKVKLERDVSNTDKYDRLLRYVYLGEIFVNLEMVKRGYAYADVIEPNVKYANELKEAELYAKTRHLGCLWS